MRIAIRIWRASMWIVGGLFIIPTGLRCLREISVPEGENIAALIYGVYFLASALALISAFALRRAARWANSISWVAASVHTLAFPVFTPLGLFGLVLLSRGAGKPGAPPAVPGAPRQRVSGLKSTVASIAISIVPMYLIIDGCFRWAKHLGYPDAPVLFGMAILCTCIFLLIAIHEAGHALAAKLMGGCVHNFQVGPFWWGREAGHSRWKFLRKLSCAGRVGWTPGTTIPLTRQGLIVAAGGPFANLLATAIAIAIFPWLGRLGVPHLWTWAMFFGAMGLAMLSNLWPTLLGIKIPMERQSTPY